MPALGPSATLAPSSTLAPSAGFAVYGSPQTGLWQLFLCDSAGEKISNLSPVVNGLRASFRLRGTHSLSFSVPSDDASVATLHADGKPYLSSKRRTIKAYRREIGYDGVERGILRFAGIVWDVQDVGDATTATTAVVCHDVRIRLARRFCRNETLGADLVGFNTYPGGEIARLLVSRANTLAPTGIDPLGLIQTTPNRTVRWEYRQMLPAISELSEAGDGFDIDFEPVDRTDGTLAAMNIWTKRGADNAELIFSWGEGRINNCSSVRRFEQGEPQAHSIVGLGADGLISIPYEPALDPVYRLSEDVVAFHDVKDQAYLDSLALSEKERRKHPREVIEVFPMTNAPAPWKDYYLGDTFRIQIGTRLRGGASVTARCYGIDLSMGDVETVDRLVTEAE